MIKKTGGKSYGKQNYLCKKCGRQFTGDHSLCYKECHSGPIRKILLMPVRGIGIRDIAEIEKISIKKVLSTPVRSRHLIRPRQRYYDTLKADEFWTCAGKKDNKVWLNHACHRKTGEIVAFVWGKRDLKTAKGLKKKLSDFGVNYGRVATSDRDSFISTFSEENHLAEKEYTVGIEGNNCRLRHRIWRAFRKTCCFSKKHFTHLKAFIPVFFYINFGFV
jgi:IS1 family transposase